MELDTGINGYKEIQIVTLNSKRVDLRTALESVGKRWSKPENPSKNHA
jgi:hypothetical protein